MEGIMMNNGLNETNDEIKLDSDKLKRMLQKVYRIERELSIIILDRLLAIKK